jgi:hypothetical protein
METRTSIGYFQPQGKQNNMKAAFLAVRALALASACLNASTLDLSSFPWGREINEKHRCGCDE